MRYPPCLPKLLSIALVAIAGIGCAGTPTHEDATRVQSGVIESIAPNSTQVSALTGMLVGGVLGNGTSSTENRQVGLALGALGGAWAISTSGHGIASPGYKVTVRFDDGELGFFNHKDPVSIQVGQRVMVSAHKLYEPSALADNQVPQQAALRASP